MYVEEYGEQLFLPYVVHSHHHSFTCYRFGKIAKKKNTHDRRTNFLMEKELCLEQQMKVI